MTMGKTTAFLWFSFYWKNHLGNHKSVCGFVYSGHPIWVKSYEWDVTFCICLLSPVPSMLYHVSILCVCVCVCVCVCFIVKCWEPPREIPPMTKVMWREPDRQRQIRPREIPWICSSIYPKTRICLSYYFVIFTNSSDINRGAIPDYLSLEKINLGL